MAFIDQLLGYPSPFEMLTGLLMVGAAIVALLLLLRGGRRRGLSAAEERRLDELRYWKS